MSLVTTCPDCATAFKVKPEHLTARRGDVCCGKCGFIFNALDHLAEMPAPEEALEVFADTLTDKEPEDTHNTAAVEPENKDESFVDIGNIPSSEIPSDENSPDGISYDIETTAQPESDSTTASFAEQPDEPLPIPEPITSTEEAPPASTPGVGLLEAKPKRRFSFLLSGLLATMLLASGLGQGVYFLRTPLAAQFPPAQPWLSQFCTMLGCTIALPQQADLLTIDESDLQQDAEHENVAILSATLINHARYAQAYPALEVTLTDTNDHSVLRRIFRPEEYLPKDTDLKAGMSPDIDTRIRLHLFTSNVKATGYRIYISYL